MYVVVSLISAQQLLFAYFYFDFALRPTTTALFCYEIILSAYALQTLWGLWISTRYDMRE